ncbi:hypothetical protein A0H81_12582 [Grifola frondosa]|uniref:Uncharacterized protein n=1 Tax=Grifola frondosa TaxID=5627 RepID=A0A1C7LTE2_GRIFR|nr:hypothetical protein A0H81_12582 [Grifola frondosa]
MFSKQLLISKWRKTLTCQCHCPCSFGELNTIRHRKFYNSATIKPNRQVESSYFRVQTWQAGPHYSHCREAETLILVLIIFDHFHPRPNRFAILSEHRRRG